MEDYAALHFVGFDPIKRPAQFAAAVRVFGRPDFIHRHWDVRAAYGGERGPHDVWVFVGSINPDAAPSPFAFDDSAFV